MSPASMQRLVDSLAAYVAERVDDLPGVNKFQRLPDGEKDRYRKVARAFLDWAGDREKRDLGIRLEDA